MTLQTTIAKALDGMTLADLVKTATPKSTKENALHA
jgi:hypothetical protein